MENIKDIEKKLGIVFKDKSLLTTAFTHSSFANMNNTKSNERLEFLGDSLLNFITTKYLYNNFQLNEGELSKIKAYLVSSDNLSKVIDDLNVIEYLRHGSFDAGKSKNVRCDLFEAILGAVYLDSYFDVAEKFVIEKLQFSKNNIESLMHKVVDYKTKLQEFVQQNGKNTIEYILLKQTGKAHEPNFVVELKIDGKTICNYTANSKKLAENMCAKYALELMNK